MMHTDRTTDVTDGRDEEGFVLHNLKSTLSVVSVVSVVNQLFGVGSRRLKP